MATIRRHSADNPRQVFYAARYGIRTKAHSKEFYDLVDRFIGLANELTRDHPTSRISSVIMCAAARYNAHCMMALDPKAAENRSAAADYFTEQYRSMLEDNIDDLMQSAKDRDG